jgi:predicted patatin/cPLA2 family phospholipase
LPDHKATCRVLSLDGGGAKGVYSLGVLKEVEALAGKPLCDVFDLIYGTSTGSIIGAMLGLGWSVSDILENYKENVPSIMKARSAAGKSAALKAAGDRIFAGKDFHDMKTDIGIVSTRWQTEKPMIFKTGVHLAHGRKATFVPGFGVSLIDAIQASCSAYPFFERKFVTTSSGDEIELMDGGYCANNPTLFALTDATGPLGHQQECCRVLSVGCGTYPEPSPSLKMWFAKKYVVTVQLLQKTMETNTNTMEQLRSFIFKAVPSVRVNDTYERPEMATDLFEHDPKKLSLLRQLGEESFAKREAEISKLLFDEV